MLTEILIFLLTSLCAYFFYTHKRIKDHFDENGVKYNSGIPVFGNLFKSAFLRRHLIYDLDEVYRSFPDEKYVGFVENTTPTIIIRDPELIKTLTVKDFDHFVDHKQFFPDNFAPLFSDSMLMMKGEIWRDMRTTLSPAFTGSKMRLMMPFMSEISRNIVCYLNENLSQEIDVRDLICRYTNDVIATTAFGLQVDSTKDKYNKFFVLGQTLFNFTALQRASIVFCSIFPKLSTIVDLKLFPKSTTKFFKDLVLDTMEYRKINNVERPDMIQLLMEVSKGTLKNTNASNNDNVGFATVDEAPQPERQLKKWTIDELAGQAFIFFVAGFESSAITVIMTIHELALNLKAQEKLYQEIKSFKETRGELTHDNINELKYLDCVLNETMRKWAAALMLDRVCTKDYELPPPREGGRPYRLKTGDIIYNMVNCLHMDEKYFPDPDRFDPDRFSDENKHNIKPFTFLPFGMGPRNCIGSRFALLELKVLLFDVVSNFKILKSKKTTDPIKLQPADFNIRAVGGTWVQFEART